MDHEDINGRGEAVTKCETHCKLGDTLIVTMVTSFRISTYSLRLYKETVQRGTSHL